MPLGGRTGTYYTREFEIMLLGPIRGQPFSRGRAVRGVSVGLGHERVDVLLGGRRRLPP
jgi:hypothetical protein